MENAAVSIFGWMLVLSSLHRSSSPWVYCLVLAISWRMGSEGQVKPMWNHSYEWLLIHWIRRAKLWGISHLPSCASSWQLPATKQNQGYPGWQQHTTDQHVLLIAATFSDPSNLTAFRKLALQDYPGSVALSIWSPWSPWKFISIHSTCLDFTVPENPRL